MSKLFVLTYFVLSVLTVSAQKYKLFESEDRVYYLKEGKKTPVYHGETLLDKNTYVKSDSSFAVEELGSHGRIIDCSPAKEYHKLEDLIKKGYIKKTVVKKTATQKGGNLFLKDIIEKEQNVDLVRNIYYFIVGVKQFRDGHWDSLPLPQVNVNKFISAIEDNLIPSNNYNLKMHEVLTDSTFTTRNYILERLNVMADSIKSNNNDLIIIYLSSHGDKDQDHKFHFIVSDSNYDSIHVKVENTIDADALYSCVNKMAAKKAKILLFVDACFSGSLIVDENRMGKNCVYYMSTESDTNANTDIIMGSPYARALAKCLSGEEQVFFRDDAYNTVTPQRLQDFLSYSVQSEYSNQKPTSKRIGIEQNEKLWKIKPSTSMVLDSLRRRARFGDTNAMVDLYSIYFFEDVALKYGEKVDTTRALHFLDYAYEWGNPRAACFYGLKYYYGIPYKDYGKACRFFEEASNRGDNLGTYYLGVCYYKGYGVTKSKKKAKKVFGRLKTINENVINAVKLEGVFVPIAYDGADRYELSIKNGQITEKIEFHMCSNSLKEALSYRPSRLTFYRELLSANSSKKMAELGKVYLLGLYDREVNYERALDLFKQSKHKMSYYYQGYMYECGLGVDKSYIKAEEYYKKAADAGYKHAYVQLGNLYYIGGYGINKDERQAVILWKKAADDKDIEGLFKYGMCLKEGVCLKKDDSTAFSYFLRSAQKGHREAIYMVGRSLFYGEGVVVDKMESYKWLKQIDDYTKAKDLLYIGFYADGTPKD